MGVQVPRWAPTSNNDIHTTFLLHSDTFECIRSFSRALSECRYLKLPALSERDLKGDDVFAVSATDEEHLVQSDKPWMV